MTDLKSDWKESRGRHWDAFKPAKSDDLTAIIAELSYLQDPSLLGGGWGS